MNGKQLLKSVAPPLAWDLARRFRQRIRGQVQGAERDAAYYDRAFDAQPKWSVHYSASPYYFLWTVIADRLLREGVDCVLDIGCGTGQLAALLRDVGVPHYVGFDFSQKRVQKAREFCPEARFEVADAFTTDLYTSVTYQAVLCTEFLEHVEGDLDVIERLPAGVRFLGTVPNFPAPAHVRCFANDQEVEARYGGHFDAFSVLTLKQDISREVQFYLLDGRTKGKADS